MTATARVAGFSGHVGAISGYPGTAAGIRENRISCHFPQAKAAMTMNIVLRIKPGAYIANGRLTSRAIQDYERLSARIDTFKNFAADRLLANCNENRTSNPVDRAAFVACLTEPSINLGDKLGSAVIWFEAGELFGGLFVEVQVEEGEATGAQVVG
jgi:hypothetical protein